MDQPKTHRLSGYGISESVVCIQGQATGTGVAITPRHVATCAHVVLDALGVARGQTSPPQADLQVSVWQDGSKRQLKLHILPAWRPVDDGDIALLELAPDESDLLPACCRVLRNDQWSQRIVEVYGYPEDFESGQWARLSCHNAIDTGVIQCSPVHQGIEGGYSGGPAFDERGDLIAIARSVFPVDDEQKHDYLIPISRVLELLPEPHAPRRQPYVALAQSFVEGAGEQLVHLKDRLRAVPPHTLEEYRLRRRLWDWQTKDIRLDFTPLLLLLEEKRRSTDFGEGPKPVPYDNLNQVLHKETHPVFLLKGAPGGGKTTLLKRLAFDLCSQADDDSLPVLVELGRHKGAMAPGAWLAQEWRNNYPNMPELDELSRDRSVCRWLSEISGERYGLPDELQWEAAARGAGNPPRRYAWGDGFARDVANCRDAQERMRVGYPTPVGLYAEGITPDSWLYDMTGNVWEWTRSAYREQPPYDTEPLDALEDASQSGVVRGGGWDGSLRNARAACRSPYSPGSRYNALGCRLCVLPHLILCRLGAVVVWSYSAGHRSGRPGVPGGHRPRFVTQGKSAFRARSVPVRAGLLRPGRE